jgi:hypothetical protein
MEKDMSGTTHSMEVSVHGSVRGGINPPFEKQRITKTYTVALSDMKPLKSLFSSVSFIS